MTKKKGKGELFDCPICNAKRSIVSTEADFVGGNQMVNTVECSKCFKQFTELWECKDWEEK